MRDGVLNGQRLYLDMLEPRRRALAERMTGNHPRVAAARARIAGMCPQLRDMLLLLLDHTDSSEIMHDVVAALTGFENRDEAASKTMSAAPARHAQVGPCIDWHSPQPEVSTHIGSNVHESAALLSKDPH